MLRRHKVLIAVNTALLAGLALAHLGVAGPAANASSLQQDRARGSFTMISANAQGQPGDALYIVDNANQDMIVMQWNSTRNRLEGVGYVKFDSGQGGR